MRRKIEAKNIKIGDQIYIPKKDITVTITSINKDGMWGKGKDINIRWGNAGTTLAETEIVEIYDPPH